MLLRGLLLLYLLYAGLAHSAEIRSVSAAEASENYVIQLTADVAMPESYVREVLQDPIRFQRVNPSIIAVEILPADASGLLRFRDHTSMCVLFFCVDYQNVVRLKILKNGDIQLDIEPKHSDFHLGHAIWKTQAIDERNTRIQLYSESLPSFWVPPFIGASMMESRMTDVMHETLLRMECEYRGDKDCKIDIIEDSTSL